MSDAAAVPVQGKDRLHHLDMIRGVALFGILLMNITSFGLPRCGYRKLNPAKTTSIECIAARRLRAIAKSIWA